jgi:hypothetical protein
MSIGYMDVRVPKEKLAKLKYEMDSASGPRKYGRYKAWLHFANLKMWQGQGHHFRYLTEVGDKRKLICTCGLYLVEGVLPESNTVSQSVRFKLLELSLDPIQTIKGHRSLNDFVSDTCALIVDYKWIEGTSDYLWTAICQECGEVLVEVRNEVAKGFVETHNRKCLVRHE